MGGPPQTDSDFENADDSDSDDTSFALHGFYNNFAEPDDVPSTMRQASRAPSHYPSSGRSSSERLRIDGYNGPYKRREQAGRDHPPVVLYQGIRVQPDSRKFVKTGLVVEASGLNAIIYANEVHAILVCGLSLQPGAWVQLDVHKLVEPQLGGSVEYLADTATIRRTQLGCRMNVLICNSHAVLDTPIQMNFKRPFGIDAYRLYSADVGSVLSTHELPIEGGGSISLTDMATGTGGSDWRVWIQLRLHEAQPQSFFLWEAVKVRGPTEMIEKKDQAQHFSNADAFNDEELEKQRDFIALRDQRADNGVNPSNGSSQADSRMSQPSSTSQANLRRHFH